MKELRIAVCDDDVIMARVFAETIQKLFYHFNAKAITKVFGHFYALQAEMEVDYFDILFLDIDMPDIDGIAFAKQLRSKNNKACIVYVSGHDEMVFDAFEVQPFAFIRKASFFKEIPDIISRFLSSHDFNGYRRITIETAKDVLSLDISNILYIEGVGKYQDIYLFGADKPIKTKCTLKELEKSLCENGFLRSHRAYLVNCQYIQRIEADMVTLTDGRWVPLSKARAEDFKMQFVRLMA